MNAARATGVLASVAMIAIDAYIWATELWTKIQRAEVATPESTAS